MQTPAIADTRWIIVNPTLLPHVQRYAASVEPTYATKEEARKALYNLPHTDITHLRVVQANA